MYSFRDKLQPEASPLGAALQPLRHLDDGWLDLDAIHPLVAQKLTSVKPASLGDKHLLVCLGYLQYYVIML